MSNKTELALLGNAAAAAIESGDLEERRKVRERLDKFKTKQPPVGRVLFDKATVIQAKINSANIDDAIAVMDIVLDLAPADAALDRGRQAAVAGERHLWSTQAVKVAGIVEGVAKAAGELRDAMNTVDDLEDAPAALQSMLGTLADLAQQVESTVNETSPEDRPSVLANVLNSLKLGLSLFEPIRETGQEIAGNLDAAAAAALNLDPGELKDNYDVVKDKLEALIAQVTDTVNQG